MKRLWKSEIRRGWRGAAVLATLAMMMGSVGCGNETTGPGGGGGTSLAEFALSPAASCDDVRDQIAETLTEDVLTHYYQTYHWRDDFAAGAPEADGQDSGASDSPSEYTDTNVQEEGVDEPDIVKTDGSYIYTLADNSLQILNSWPPEDTARVGRYDFPSGAYPRSMFLKGDIVAVFSSIWNATYYESDGSVDSQDYFYGTRISLFDVSDRSNPEPVRQLDVEGYYINGRMVDGKVYLVSNSGLRNIDAWRFAYNNEELAALLPELDYDAPEDEREAVREEARPIVRAYLDEYLAGVDASEWLPRKRIINENDEVVLSQSLYECEDLYLPQVSAELGILNISSFDMSDKTGIDSTGLLASGWQVYASQESLYIAMSSRSWWWWGWGNRDNESHIHKFSIGGDGEPAYLASGRVDGWILNQFSFSEYEGYLRVATTDNRWEWDPETGEQHDDGGNHVIVLESQNGVLEEVGSVRDLAPTEQIYSVRYMGDKAYMVTFRQTDPLYSIDLSDPTNPQMVGELKIEGYSSYMHPLDEDHLLTIGMDGDDSGMLSGVHLQVFDVSDMANPVRTQHHVISTGGWSSYSEALYNHHAFTYQARLGVLGVPMNIYENDEQFTGLMLFEAGVDGIDEIGRVDHGDLAAESWCLQQEGTVDCEPEHYWSWWSNMRRSIMMSGDTADEEYVYSISSVGLKVTKTFDSDEELASVLWRQ